MPNRAFSSEPPFKKQDVHGSTKFARLQQSPKSTNLYLTFDQALRLSLSIQSCLFQLNRYKRSTSKGKNRGLGLTIFPDVQAITVTEGSVGPTKGEAEEPGPSSAE